MSIHIYICIISSCSQVPNTAILRLYGAIYTSELPRCSVRRALMQAFFVHVLGGSSAAGKFGPSLLFVDLLVPNVAVWQLENTASYSLPCHDSFKL